MKLWFEGWNVNVAALAAGSIDWLVGLDKWTCGKGAAGRQCRQRFLRNKR
jgi:hypothetical protein